MVWQICHHEMDRQIVLGYGSGTFVPPKVTQMYSIKGRKNSVLILYQTVLVDDYKTLDFL